MQEKHALEAFAALSQETRLRIVRLLVTAGPDGLSAGAIGEAMGASSSRTSFHLSHLKKSGLVEIPPRRALDHLLRRPRTAFASCRLPDARLLPGPPGDL